MKKLLTVLWACGFLLWGCTLAGGTAARAAETPDPDADPMSVVATVLRNAEVLAHQDAAALALDAAQEQGVDKRLSGGGDALVITALDAEVGAGLGKSLRDYDNGMDVFNRAWLLRFMPGEFWDFQIVVWGAGDYWLQFDKTGYPAFGGLEYDDSNYCFGEYPQSFRLEPDQWHYCLIALDDDTNCRFVLWEEGRADELGYYARKLNGDQTVADRKAGGELPNWNLSFKLCEGETIQVSDYTVLRFEELIQ